MESTIIEKYFGVEIGIRINNDDKDHIYTGKLVQQNEFAAINQGPVNLIPRI